MVRFRRSVLALLLVACLSFGWVASAAAGTVMGDYDFYCYYVQVWHGQYQHSDRSDRIAVSHDLSNGDWILFYQAWGRHSVFGYEYWTHDFDYSCRSRRGYQ